MAKDIAISKKLKISKAQEYMILAVLGTGVIVGISLSLILHFINMIAFNANVIIERDKAIVAYSNTIENVGICKAPSGDIYTIDELKKCDPSMTNIDDVQGSLRYSVLHELAADSALNSVQRTDDSAICKNEYGEIYTYEELNQKYNDATSKEEVEAATALLKDCSALRIVADALPSQKNEFALLSSLNKIFDVSGQEWQSLSPTGEESENKISGLNSIMVNISVDAGVSDVYKTFSNIEKSIRNFNIEHATFEWSGNNTISFGAQAAAYYVDISDINDMKVNKTIKFKQNNGSKK